MLDLSVARAGGVELTDRQLPLYSTQPNPERLNLLPLYDHLAGLLGITLQPYQRYLLALSSELTDEGNLAYNEVHFSTPRQQGKSLVLSMVFLLRLICWPESREQIVALGAQSQGSARMLLVDKAWKLVQKRGLDKRAGMRLRAGAGMTDLRLDNGNHLYLLSNSKSSLHGLSATCILIDECWEAKDISAVTSLMPTMMSQGKNWQAWLSSTMGDQTSLFWHGLVEAGRARSQMKDPPGTGIAYVEWGAPDGCDYTDEENWYRANPILNEELSIDGEVTIPQPISNLRQMVEEKPQAFFERAHLNMIVTNAFERAIPESAWDNVQFKVKDAAAKGHVIIGVDTHPHRDISTLCAADADGNVEMLKVQYGKEWVKSHLLAAFDRHPDVKGIAFLKGGMWLSLMEDPDMAHVPMWSLSAEESAKASVGFYDSVIAENMRVSKCLELDQAVACAKKHDRGGTWYWTSVAIDLDVAPLIAATVAHYIARREGLKPPLGPPSISSLDSSDVDAMSAERKKRYDERVKRWSQ